MFDNFAPFAEGETWKDIPSFEGYYQVSDFGRIRSIPRTMFRKGTTSPIRYKGRILKQHMNPDGYMRISFSKDCEPFSFAVHRLVAISFIQNPNNLPDVNHKDWVRNNNIVSNLEWSTEADNVSYSYSKPYFVNKRKGKNCCKISKPIICTNTDMRFSSIHEAARLLKIPRTSIKDVLDKKHNHTHGLVFIYCPC